MKSEGAASAMQLAHAGRKAATDRAIDGTNPLPPDQAWPAVGPTTQPTTPRDQAPHALTKAEIAGIVKAFADAARRAEAAGFDIVEIHGAHGYLLASFLSAISNTRDDGYGGDRAGRMRFPLEVTCAVRAVWPSHKPLFFRVSSVDGADGWNLDDTVALALELKSLGVEIVDCSSGGLTGTATAAPIPRHPGFQVPYAEAVKKAGVPSMAVGPILDGPQAEQVLREGKADLIAIGRQALYDPYLAPPHRRGPGLRPALQSVARGIRLVAGEAEPIAGSRLMPGFRSAIKDDVPARLVAAFFRPPASGRGRVERN
jgi:2,4-dienoyl-CoA reductase-like NADH-dependent reductase (Old Yellow Enzyme family)